VQLAGVSSVDLLIHRIDNLGHQGHHLVEVTRRDQVTDAWKDATVDIDRAAHGRQEAPGRQEPVVLADSDDTRQPGSTSQELSG
jgi:hypothetical protein